MSTLVLAELLTPSLKNNEPLYQSRNALELIRAYMDQPENIPYAASASLLEATNNQIRGSSATMSNKPEFERSPAGDTRRQTCPTVDSSAKPYTQSLTQFFCENEVSTVPEARRHDDIITAQRLQSYFIELNKIDKTNVEYYKTALTYLTYVTVWMKKVYEDNNALNWQGSLPIGKQLHQYILSIFNNDKITNEMKTAIEGCDDNLVESLAVLAETPGITHGEAIMKMIDLIRVIKKIPVGKQVVTWKKMVENLVFGGLQTAVPIAGALNQTLFYLDRDSWLYTGTGIFLGALHLKGYGQQLYQQAMKP